MSDLINAMGIAGPSLYAAFGSKEKLYQDALAMYQTRHGGYFSAALAQSGAIRSVILDVLRASARQFTNPGHPRGCMIATGIMQCSENNQHISDQTRWARDEAQRMLKQRLDLASKQGELPSNFDTAVLANFFAVVIQGMAVQAHDGADAAVLEKMVDVAIGVLPSAETSSTT